MTYALVNKKLVNEDGNSLVRVGYTSNLPVRQESYPRHANAGKRASVYDDIRKQGIDDFEWVFLDIQIGKAAAQISEEFFTIYFNIDPSSPGSIGFSPPGVDLRKNKKYNPVIGDIYGKEGKAHPLYKDVQFYEVKNLIESGYGLTDIAIRLGISSRTLAKKIRSWGDLDSNFNYDQWVREIRTKKLKDLYKEGMRPNEIVKQFEKYALPNKEEIASDVKKVKEIDINALKTIHYSEQTIEIWTKEYLGVNHETAYEIYYVKPILANLARLRLSKAQAFDIIEALGIISPRGIPYGKTAIKKLLQNMQWGSDQAFYWQDFKDEMVEPIIEELIRYKGDDGKRITVIEMAEILKSSTAFVTLFIRRRWGFNTLKEAREFFETHYMGYHKYDFYIS